MDFLRRTSRAGESTGDDGESGPSGPTKGDEDSDGRVNASRHQTAAKGRPTPSRREARGRRRGPVAAPTTQRGAWKRARQTEDARDERRTAAADRRARRRAGDDRVLAARDRGPVRAHIRDLVDSRAHLLGLFAPLAVVGFVLTLTSSREVTGTGQLLALGLLAAMALEGVLLGVLVTRQVRARFPDDATTGVSLGWYSLTRAAQVRKLRVPAPRVSRGDHVA